LPYSIQIARTARQDASEYAAFIRDEQKSPEAARRWLDGLYVVIKQLHEAPNRFSAIPEADELGFPYRSFMYHSHRIIYAVYDTEQRIMIHRIYHGARRALNPNDL